MFRKQFCDTEEHSIKFYHYCATLCFAVISYNSPNNSRRILKFSHLSACANRYVRTYVRQSCSPFRGVPRAVVTFTKALFIRSLGRRKWQKARSFAYRTFAPFAYITRWPVVPGMCIALSCVHFNPSCRPFSRSSGTPEVCTFQETVAPRTFAR